MITVTESIKNPTGSSLSNVLITITCIESAEVIKGAKSVEKSDEENKFNFTLSLGRYRVTVGREQKPIFYDKEVLVDEATPSTLTITELLNNYVYTEPSNGCE